MAPLSKRAMRSFQEFGNAMAVWTSRFMEVSMFRSMKAILLFVVLFTVQGAWAQIEYITDLEGRVEPLRALIEDGVLVEKPGGLLDFADDKRKIVFGGDLMDRGPHSVRLIRYLLNLKALYPDRVILLQGNRDLNKLSFLFEARDSMKAASNTEYRTFLETKATEAGEGPDAIERYNTPANQVEWWAKKFGLWKAVEFHQQELREIYSREFTLTEAATDYHDFITNPNREFLKYVRAGQLAYIHVSAKESVQAFMHGGLPAQNGFVPDSAKTYENIVEWANELNRWGRSSVDLILDGVKTGRLSDQARKFVIYSDALFDSSTQSVWKHDNSVIYGQRYKEDGNFRLPTPENLQWLKSNRVDLMVLGHSPAGNVPTPLRGDGLMVFMGDTSYAPNGTATRITIDKSVVSVRGVLEDGTAVRYTTSPKSKDMLGLIRGNETVVAKTGDGRYVTFRYDGYNRIEKVYQESELKSQELKKPVYESNSEFLAQKEALISALEKRGVAIIDTLTFGNDHLNGRRPVLFAGSSAYADSSQEINARQMIEAALRQFDPGKVVIVTGATDHGSEKIVHEVASRMGFHIHGLVVSATVPQEISPHIKTVSWVGDDWAAQPKSGMSLIRSHGGLGIILGGGGLLQKGLEYGASIGAKFLVASNIRHGNGSVSASMNFSKTMPNLAFDNASSLVRQIKRSAPSAVRKSIVESTAEQTINEMKNRGKKVVTFVGFSGLGYENPEILNEVFRQELAQMDSRRVIINIGGTPDGIGALYETAKGMGFETTGVVSSQAKVDWLSPYVDRVYMIKDARWGGYVAGTEVLSPTSKAMIGVSDMMIAIGGGAVGRDEFIEATKRGIPTRFISAEMNHKIASEKARKAGRPVPTEFRGELEFYISKLGPAPTGETKLRTRIEDLRTQRMMDAQRGSGQFTKPEDIANKARRK